jgi:sulfonate transport system substrate-binding protein
MKRIFFGLLVVFSGIFFTLSCSIAGEAGKAKVTIRIAYPFAGTLVNGQIGQIFERTDILDKNGLEGRVTAFQYGPPMMEALLSGKMDVALTSEQNVVVLLAKGFPAHVIASLGSAGRLGLLVPVNSSIKSMLDLKGKKVGTIFGSSVHRPILLWLQEVNLIPGKDVEVINMSGGELNAALVSGSLDAIMSWDPYVEDFIQKKIARVIREQSFSLAVIMADDFIQKSPEAAADFLIALKEAALYMVTHKEQVNNWYSQLCRLDTQLIDKSSQFNGIYNKAKTLSDIDLTSGKDFIKTLEDIADFLFTEGLTSKRADITVGVDLELIKKAEKKLSKIQYDPSMVKVTAP